MQLAPQEIGRRTIDGAVFRHEPLRMTMTIGPVVARDGHELSAACGFSVRLAERGADIELFKEQLLAGTDVVTLDTVRQRLANDLTASLRAFADSHEASLCLAQRETVGQLLFQRAGEIGFGCGLEFLPPFDVTVHCPSLDAQRVAEQISTRQTQQLDRAAETLERLRSLGSVAQLRADEQATVLQLLMKSAPPTPLWVVAGAKLIEYTPSTGDARALPLPETLGPLRSVRRVMIDHAPRLLLGAQRGVGVRVGEEVAAYLSQSISERGFNSVAIDPPARLVAAAHGELGILRWDAGTAQPLPPVTVDGEPRFLTAIDERLVFATGEQLLTLDSAGTHLAHRAEGDIIAILPLPDALILVRENGVIERLDRSTLRPIDTLKRSARLLAATLMSLEGLAAITLSPEAGPIDIVSLTGAPLLELHAPQQGLRMLAHAGGYVVGVSADRQSLVTWDGFRAGAPVRALNVVAKFGHRIADICA